MSKIDRARATSGDSTRTSRLLRRVARRRGTRQDARARTRSRSSTRRRAGASRGRCRAGVETIGGDYEMGHFDGDSDRVVMVCRTAIVDIVETVSGSSTEAQIRLLLVEDMPQVAQLHPQPARHPDEDQAARGRYATADRCIDQIREHQPDVLIVDALLQGKHQRPRRRQEVREAGLDLPIIALTVPQKPVKVGEGMGATEVLSMPFSGYDFMRLLQDMHDAQRARRQSRCRASTRSSAPRAASAPRRSPTTSRRRIAAHALSRRADRRQPPVRRYSRAAARHGGRRRRSSNCPPTHIQRADLEQVMYRDKSGVEVLLRTAAHRDGRDGHAARHRADAVAHEEGLQRRDHRHRDDGRRHGAGVPRQQRRADPGGDLRMDVAASARGR